MKASGPGKALTARIAKNKEIKSAIAKAGGASPQSVGEGPYKVFKAVFEVLETVDDCRNKTLKNVGRLHKDLVAALNKDADRTAQKDAARCDGDGQTEGCQKADGLSR